MATTKSKSGIIPRVSCTTRINPDSHRSYRAEISKTTTTASPGWHAATHSRWRKPSCVMSINYNNAKTLLPAIENYARKRIASSLDHFRIFTCQCRTINPQNSRTMPSKIPNTKALSHPKSNQSCCREVKMHRPNSATQRQISSHSSLRGIVPVILIETEAISSHW